MVHRKQASVYEIAQKLPHFAGYLVSAETAVLKKLTVDPARPYAVILGGSKVSDKLGVITSLLPRVDSLLIGGGMAFTFLAAQGLGVGASLLQEDQIEVCKNLLAENADKIVLPTDVVIADAFSADAAIQIVGADGILDGWLGLDIGPRERRRGSPRLHRAPAPSSGTARWACSSSLRSPTAPVRSPRRFRRHPRSPWSAAATPPPPCAFSASTNPASPTSRPVAALPWNTSRAKSSPASQSWRHNHVARKPLIAGNWKMNLTHLEGIALVQKIAFTLPEKYYKHVEVAVIPPFTALRSVQTLVEADKLSIVFGAQDLSAYDSGAYTGEISGAQLAKLACTYVLVGHSERREYHHESDELLAKKVNAAYKHGLIPLLCFGEGLEVREAGNQVQHSVDQMLAAMVDVTPEQAASIVLAYEPVWAIGTGRVATPADAQEVCGAARAALAEKYGAEIADGIRILYGGSVKSGNVGEITAQPDVDGALVGGASLDGTEFANLAANAVGILP